MIEFIKEKTARFLISQKLKNASLSEQSFSTALKKAGSFLVLMPEDEKDFRTCFFVLDYIEQLNKSIRILTRDYRVSLLPAKYRNKSIEVGVNDLNKLDLPNNKLNHRLSELRFDGVIDLNRGDHLFYSFISNLVKARLRIGFTKKDSDKYYNFQIANNENDSEKSYNNFLNSLKMF